MKSDAHLEGGSRDQTEIQGYFTVEVIRDGPFGPQVVRRQRRKHNLVVNDGKEEILRIACGMQSKVFDNMRLGKCDTTPTSADTGVKTAVAGSLETVDVTTFDGRTMQLIISYPSGTTATSPISATSINEIAIMLQHTSPGGTALNRSLITATDKTKSDKLKITYECHVT
jgi:hypothetical protein